MSSWGLECGLPNVGAAKCLRYELNKEDEVTGVARKHASLAGSKLGG